MGLSQCQPRNENVAHTGDTPRVPLPELCLSPVLFPELTIVLKLVFVVPVQTIIFLLHVSVSLNSIYYRLVCFALRRSSVTPWVPCYLFAQYFAWQSVCCAMWSFSQPFAQLYHIPLCARTA